MLHVDVPSLPEMRSLVGVRAEAAVSIYLPTTPHGQHSDASRIELGNLLKAAVAQLEATDFDKRQKAAIEEQVQALREDDDFWQMQAHSLAVLVTPKRLLTFRLATALKPMVAVSDRYHLTPLLRSVGFSQHAYVLALSENAARVTEIFADSAPVEVRVPDLPKDAASAAGRASVNNLTQNTRLANAEGQTVLLRQYARKVDAALRPFLAGRETPLLLAAAEPLASIYRNASSYPALLAEGISASPDRMSDSELAAASREILAAHHAAQIEAAMGLFASRGNEGRATSDITQAARAASQGAVEMLLVDIEAAQPGLVDADGAVTFADAEGADSYDVIDEICGRALLTGAQIMGVRASDLPKGASLAAVLRYPV
jgi:hypothetical protein